MVDQVLSLFDIQPKHDLNFMQIDQSLSRLNTDLFTGLDPIIEETKPDWILALGNTTTDLVAGLVAYNHEVPFGHIEAGLRTYDR